MVPNIKLYNMNIVNRLKTLNTLFISNSVYTQHWLQKWGVKSDVIYPYVTNDLLETKLEIKKEKSFFLWEGFWPSPCQKA